MLAVTADGAVASFDSRPLTVAPLPMLYVLPILIAPSARLASDEAGTVAVQIPAPLAGAVIDFPLPSVSVTPDALAPGCETPVIVRSPAATLLISARLTLLASLGAYAAVQPATGPGVAP